MVFVNETPEEKRRRVITELVDGLVDCDMIKSFRGPDGLMTYENVEFKELSPDGTATYLLDDMLKKGIIKRPSSPKPRKY